MPTYRVEGADEVSGRDVAKTIVADNETAAATQARASGILVSGVRLAAVVTPKTAASATSSASLPYAGSSAAVPSYKGLSIAASVLMIYAALLYVVGGIAILLGAVVVLRGIASQDLIAAGVMDAAAAIGPGLTALFFAAMAHGASAALLALRDIAINSF